MRKLAIIFATLLLVSCSGKLSKTVGLSTSGPNEYLVSSNKSLEMPPHFTLEEVKNSIDGKGSDQTKADEKNEPEKVELSPAEKSLLKASESN